MAVRPAVAVPWRVVHSQDRVSSGTEEVINYYHFLQLLLCIYRCKSSDGGAQHSTAQLTQSIYGIIKKLRYPWVLQDRPTDWQLSIYGIKKFRYPWVLRDRPTDCWHLSIYGIKVTVPTGTAGPVRRCPVSDHWSSQLTKTDCWKVWNWWHWIKEIIMGGNNLKTNCSDPHTEGILKKLKFSLYDKEIW